jgi:hypothetical protein
VRRTLKPVFALLLLALAPCSTGPARADGLRAGAARVALAVPAGTPLAGYGALDRRLLVPDVLGRHPHAFWFKPNEGTLDPLAARALVIEGGGQRLTWIAVDLVAVDRAFTARVARALVQAGLRPGTLIVSASHTHSGPGAFMESGFLGVVSAERQDREVTGALVSSVVDAVRRAETAKSPARVGSASVVAPALTVGRLRQEVDREIVVLKVVSEAGPPIALLWNYAIHGTMLPAVNLRLSGDVMGIAGRELERMTGVPALFVNGAVGDVSPARHGGVEAAHAGRELAAAVFSGWETARAVRADPLVVGSTRVPLPGPFLSIRNCTSRWVPGWLTLPLRLVLPADAELIGGRLGDVAWVTVPGELQSWLGEVVKRAGRRGTRHAFVAGLSNDYLGYFITEADYDRVAYVACASLYGPEAGERLTRAAEKLIGEFATTGTRR